MPTLKPYRGKFSLLRPMRPSDIADTEVQFPCYVQPKIDGVRALNLNQRGITGRSLKPFANRMLSEISSHITNGLDGELYYGTPDNITSPALCRDTTSLVNTIDRREHMTWVLFDYITENTAHLWYSDRITLLEEYIKVLRLNGLHSKLSFVLVPQQYCKTREELLYWEKEFLFQGYEGIVTRKPAGFYKSGYVTTTEQYCHRIKRFTDAEAIVLSVEEGMKNNNEQTINELGYASRTTHKDEKEPNGMVGTLVCKDVKSGTIIRVSPGKMTHEERVRYWHNQTQILGQTIKYKHFEKGVKDKPRSATFQCFRLQEDL